MTEKPVLVDSNTYFRLARSIHPLLLQRFGEAGYCLYAVKDLDEEFQRSPRLRSKFHWVDEPAYAMNRRRPLTVLRTQRAALLQAHDFMSNHARIAGLGVSSVDVHVLATAYTCGVPVVTDDQDMLILAREFGVRALTTLDLMRLMLDSGHIDMEKVRQIAAYWQYEKDTPAGFRADYPRLFGEPVPPPL